MEKLPEVLAVKMTTAQVAKFFISKLGETPATTAAAVAAPLGAAAGGGETCVVIQQQNQN